MCRDPINALEDIISAGAARILTSGQASTAMDGANCNKNPCDRMQVTRSYIMPGGGIDEYNIALLAGTTGAREFHLSGTPDRRKPDDFPQKRNLHGRPPSAFRNIRPKLPMLNA